MFKKVVNIILILVLAITILPIKQVGNMLFNNQWTEELSDHADNVLEKKSQPGKWNFLAGPAEIIYGGTSQINPGSKPSMLIQTLPSNPSGEIHSPPPNLLP